MSNEQHVIDYSAILEQLGRGEIDNLEENLQNAEDNRNELLSQTLGDVINSNAQHQFDTFSMSLKLDTIDDMAEFFDVDVMTPESDSLEHIERKTMELYSVNLFLHDELIKEKKSFENEIEYLDYRRNNQEYTVKTTNFGQFLNNNMIIKQLKNIVLPICEYKLKIFSLQEAVDINIEIPEYSKNFAADYWQELTKYIRTQRLKNENGYIVQNVPGTTTWQPYIKKGKHVDIEGLVTCFEDHKKKTDAQFYNKYVDPTHHSKFVHLLKKSDNSDFEKIEYSRFAYQFKNGVYIANSVKLPDDYFVSNSSLRNIEIKDKTGQFIPNTDPNYKLACLTTFTSEYFPYDFDDNIYGHWSDIETPYLDSILDYQNLSPDVKNWIYILLGRLLYPVALFDDWELVLFLFGEPGCGKSRILSIIGHIVGIKNVGAITAGNTLDYILGDLRNKQLILIDEVKNDLAITASMFQSMASGAVMSSYTKYQNLIVGTWKPPMAMAGNDKLPYQDEGTDSVVRRLALVEFLYTYVHKEGTEPINLEAELIKETPKILRKINEAYLDTAHRYKGHQIRNYMPQYFKDVLNVYSTTNNILAEAMKTLLDPAVGAFVNSDSEEDYITFSHFQRACKAQNITLRRFTKEKAFLNIMKKMNYSIVLVGEESRVLKIKATFDL